jgi:hypothetical protein
MGFEPDFGPSKANCWSTGAMSSYYSPSTVITGGLSGRSNQLTSSLPTSCWIKSPWMKMGTGNITMNVRLDGAAATSRALRVRFIPYDENAGVYKQGAAIADSSSYAFASPVSGSSATNIRSLTFAIPASIANTNSAYIVMISFMGSGGTGRVYIDDISIPGTYWSDPSNSCLPLTLIVDNDKDGVQDADDAYPNDVLRAFDNIMAINR